MLRLRLRLRYNGWDAGTAAVLECRDGGSTGMQGNLGLEGRRQWKLQGTLGGGEYEVCFWLNPSQVYIEPF